MKGSSSPNDTPKPRKKLPKRPFFDSADRHEKLYGRSRLYASAQGRHETGGVLSLFSRLSFDISIQNSVQRWSSDFQGLFRVKIRKMAQGSDDLSTLPLTFLPVRTRGRISCLGLRVDRTVFVDANGNKQESRGGGRVCSMRWNSVMQRISRLQRSDGQVSCSNITDLEAWKGARRIDRATEPWTRSRARASRSRRAPCQTGHAYSSFGRR